MNYFALTKQEQVYVLTMKNGLDANRLDDEMLLQFHRYLDTVSNDSATNLALVITADDEKAFSHGINLEFVQSRGASYLFDSFVPSLDALLTRLAWLDVPTVAAINGHAFGGGALIASACDFRTMRADRGFFCFPEVDLKLWLSPVMLECVNNLPNEAARTMLALTGRKLGGEEAAALQIVDAAYPADSLLPNTLQLAAQLASKDRTAYSKIKRGLRATRWAKFVA